MDKRSPLHGAQHCLSPPSTATTTTIGPAAATTTAAVDERNVRSDVPGTEDEAVDQTAKEKQELQGRTVLPLLEPRAQ